MDDKKFVKDPNATDVADKTPAQAAGDAIKAAKASAAAEPENPKAVEKKPEPVIATATATAAAEPAGPGGGNPPPPDDGKKGGGNSGDDGATPPTPPTPPQPQPPSNGPVWLVWLLLGIGVAAAVVALVFGFTNAFQNFDLANRKAERSEVQAVDVKATKALADTATANATIGEVKADVAGVKKDLTATTEIAKKALAKADEKCKSCASGVKADKKRNESAVVQSTPKVSTAPTVAPVITQETPCTNCVSTPIAIDHGHSAPINGLCTITVIKDGDRSKTVAKLVVTKHAQTGKILVTQVEEYTKDPKTTKIIGRPVWTPFTSPGTCDGDKALVTGSWAKVVEMMHLPNDCKPN